MVTKGNVTFKKIATHQLKDVSDLCSPFLGNIWNEEILLNENCLENLKLADVISIFKRKDETFVVNFFLVVSSQVYQVYYALFL